MKHALSIFNVILLFSTASLISRAGDLDPTFGSGNGFVTTDIFNNTIDDGATGIAIQQESKIVACGVSGSRAAIARYNMDGSLDTSFANNGALITLYGGTQSRHNGIVIQPDGKILVAGQTNAGGGPNKFLIARYTIDGLLDTTFGTNGFTTTNFTMTSDDGATSLALQADGKIVVSGFTQDSGTSNFGLARYATNGTLDSSFGTNGKVITNFDKDSASYSVLVQPDGKIVAAGYLADQNDLPVDFAVARYLSNGLLDNSFGPVNDGKNITNFGASINQAFSVALQSDGKILVVGYANFDPISSIDIFPLSGIDLYPPIDLIEEDNGFNIGIVRYTKSGLEDTSFGPMGNGKVLTNSMSGGISVVVQPDDKIVLGALRINEVGTTFIKPVRYTSDGFLDPTFGDNGVVNTNLIIVQSNNTPFTQAILQPDGRILISGGTPSNNGDFIVARFLGDTLAVTKKASSEQPCPGQNITYTITATNFGAGGGTVNGIEIQDVLPSELIFRSAQTNGEASGFNPATGVWSIPCLRIGGTAKLKIKARVGQCAGNQVICNTAITRYSSIDNVTDSSLFEELGISTTEIFSTAECVSTLPVIHENINNIANRIDCNVDDIDTQTYVLTNKICDIEKQQVITEGLLKQAILKLSCLANFFSATDCLF